MNKNHYLKRNFEKPLLSIIAIVLTQWASGQCTYVQKISDNDSINTVLPANFPMFDNTGNPQKDNEKFQNEKDKWMLENPNFTVVSFGLNWENSYILIPKDIFQSFDKLKQEIIVRNTKIYHLN